MKILFLPAYFTPEKVTSLYLWHNLLESFAKSGYKTVLYVPIPSRGVSETVRKEFQKRKHEQLFNGNVQIHRFLMFKNKKNTVLRTIRYILVNIVQFYKGLIASEIDMIIVASTPPTQGFIAALLKRFKKVPFIYCLQDIFPDSLAATGLTKKGSFLWKIGRIIENFTYKNADKIIVISEDFKKNILEKGVPESKIEVIYNWVDENEVVPVPRSENKLFDELGLNRSLFYIVYAGNLGYAQNIDIIIEAAKRLGSYERIRFIIFGSGNLEDDLKEKAIKLDLNNIEFYPIQSSEKISNVYSLGNASVVTCKPGFGNSAMPSKTWSIMSSGTAIIANFDEGTELQKIVVDSECGIFTNSGNVDSFSDAILKLYKESVLCEYFGKNGRKFILNNLTREIGTSKYKKVIHSVMSKV